MKPRPRKRRNSEDIARDALVEQVLHERRLDLYEKDPETGKGIGRPDAHDDTDERLAEQFQQEYMDAMAQRQQRNKPAAQTKVAGGAAPESKGPRLGGSRSARAKMHQQQQLSQPKK
jgi:hypothetical protein